MRKLIAGINVTLDGFCDHTVTVADEELHQHYNELLARSETLVYGRTTYQLMETYWPAVVENPTGNQATDEFAALIDNIEKIVFSRTLKAVTWNNTRLATGDIREELQQLKQQPGGDILVGSPSLITQCLSLNVVDELQLCIQPIIAGKGLMLWKTIEEKINLRLIKTKTLSSSGSIVLYYEPAMNS